MIALRRAGHYGCLVLDLWLSMRWSLIMPVFCCIGRKTINYSLIDGNIGSDLFDEGVAVPVPEGEIVGLGESAVAFALVGLPVTAVLGLFDF